VLPILVGLAASELSVAAARVGEVRERVRNLRFDECKKLAVGLLGKVADAGRERV
jgi:phosphoenolpyruvate-protein kinase (PTS system EI component)